MLQSVKMSNCLRNSASSNLLRTLTARGISNMNKSSVAVECLQQRGILRVSGKESSVFLQGLITNDMRHLEEGSLSMYTMFLNTKGRVMYDAIIYRTNKSDAYLVECDADALPALQKHLKLFRVRKKIDIDNVENELKIWVTFNPKVADIMYECSVNGTKENVSHLSSNILESQEYTNNDSQLKHLLSRQNLIICRDPRLTALGARIVAPASEDLFSLGTCPPQYKLFRYKLGIGEGVDELPPGKCFPLEVNGDYLHGVSFHKGCYVGQELTARTHHTGVIRKRLMPLFFDIVPTSGFVQDTPILAANLCNKSPVGKLRGREQNVGLGLLRIVEALNNSILNVLDGTAQTIKPLWWPREAPKERVSKDEAN